MEKEVIVMASVYKQKYYFNEKFKDLPKEVVKELKETVIILAEKLHCEVSINFFDGEILMEANALEYDYNYDEIGSALEIKKFEREKGETIEGLKMWYKIYFGEK